MTDIYVVIIKTILRSTVLNIIIVFAVIFFTNLQNFKVQTIPLKYKNLPDLHQKNKKNNSKR